MHEITQNISINSNDSTHRTQQRVKQLSIQIALTQKDFQSLFAKPGKFSSRVIDFNLEAMVNLENDRPDQALVYLIEAEKILEKAGEKGLDVEKRLVVLTLHNLACAYQRNWELDVCANYLEALIYNLNIVLKNIEACPSDILIELPPIKSTSAVSPKPLSSKTTEMILSIELKERLGRYYLQFCAVNSQIRNHSGALISARKSIQAMKRTFNELFILLKQHSAKQSCPSQFEQKLHLFHQVSHINDNINVSQYEMILQTTKFYLRKWQNSEEKEMVISEMSSQIEAKFKNFSIGSIAQMSPVQYSELFAITEINKNQIFKTESIIEKILVLIIGYFTISTELRLLAESKNPISQLSEASISIHIRNSHEPKTREAQIFHLFSILLASIFIPFQILYMKHILLSYRNHYEVELFDGKDDKVQITESSKTYDQFLFTISEIRRGSMKVVEADSEMRISDVKSSGEVRKVTLKNKKLLNKFSNIVEDLDQKAVNKKSKSKTKRNTKSKSKSQTKKSTVKTVSALSAHSKNKQKVQTKSTKSPQIHTQPSLSKSKHKKASSKLPFKMTSLHQLAEENIKKKQKNKEAGKKKHEYAGIKPIETKKKKNPNIEQTNAYFLKKSTSNVKTQQSKSKSKESKIRKDGGKSPMMNNAAELYLMREKVKESSKSRSKEKLMKKPPALQKQPNLNMVGSITMSKRGLNNHYN